MNKENAKDCNYHYDYANKCDCSDDDNCGCTYPNNMPHDVDCLCSADDNFQIPDNQTCLCNAQGEKNEK